MILLSFLFLKLITLLTYLDSINLWLGMPNAHEKLKHPKQEIRVMRKVIDKGFFSEAFLFKPRGGRSPPSGLNRKPRKNPLFSL